MVATVYNVYYRTSVEDKKPKLRCIAVDVSHWKEAQQAVLEQLHFDMEVFLDPVLTLIHGTKSN